VGIIVIGADEQPGPRLAERDEYVDATSPAAQPTGYQAWRCNRDSARNPAEFATI